MSVNKRSKSSRGRIWTLLFWICFGVIGLPAITLAMQKTFIESYSISTLVVEFGPLYYHMTIFFVALFGIVLGIITAISINLWKDGNMRATRIVLFWGGLSTSMFFIYSIIDGEIRMVQDKSRGIHTNIMNVPALIWSLVLLATGLLLYAKKHRILPPPNL